MALIFIIDEARRVSTETILPYILNRAFKSNPGKNFDKEVEDQDSNLLSYA